SPTAEPRLQNLAIYPKRIEVHGNRAVTNDDIAHGRIKMPCFISKSDGPPTDRWIDSGRPLDKPRSIARRDNSEVHLSLRGASPLGLPYTLSREPLRRLA